MANLTLMQANAQTGTGAGTIAGVSTATAVIVGGVTIAGVIIAAAILSVLPLWFQFIDDYKILVYSALLFIMMRFAPDGLAGLTNRLIKSLRKKV